MTQDLGEIIRFSSLPQVSTETLVHHSVDSKLCWRRSGNFFTYIFCVQFNFLAEKQSLQTPNLISEPQSTIADSALIHHQSDWPLIGVEMDTGSTTADLLKEKYEPK